ncbi:unnamed protein product [Coccothraustes coccothraustes]
MFPPLSVTPARPPPDFRPLPAGKGRAAAALPAGREPVRARRTRRCSEIASGGGRRAVFTRERGESFRCPVPGRRRWRGFPRSHPAAVAQCLRDAHGNPRNAGHQASREPAHPGRNAAGGVIARPGDAATALG